MLRGGLKMSLVVLRSRQARAPATGGFNLDRSLSRSHLPGDHARTSGAHGREAFQPHEYEKVRSWPRPIRAEAGRAMERLLKSLGEFRSNASFLETI